MKKKEAPSEGGEWTRHRIQKTNLSLISMGRSGDNHCSIDIVNILIIIGQQISNLGGWLDECLRSIPVLECIRTARFQIFRISLAPADCRLSHRQDEQTQRLPPNGRIAAGWRWYLHLLLGSQTARNIYRSLEATGPFSSLI
jgi:hypothetical protein